MTDATPRLGLPLIAAAQAQKHVTHNEALGLLDALVQLACLDKDLAAPPPSPAAGDRYLVAAVNPGGAWAGLSGQVVRFEDGVWVGAVPRPGWFAYVIDEADLYLFDGTAWTSFRRAITAIQVTSRLGINTDPDATNRLAVKSDAALLSWDDVTPGSGDMRVAVNKRSAARDAGLVFQTGYAARALLGTLGGDDFSLKVSADGAAFATVLTASAATGGVDFTSAETALAASATTDLGAAGTRRVLVTGSATVASFGAGANRERLVRFAGAATLTHDPARLVLPTRANIVTAADDTCLASSDAAGNWRVRHYQRADGTALAGGGAGGGGSGVPASRQVLGAGLATGGGDLSADRTVTVPKAAPADVAAGTDDAKALTAYSVAAALAARAPLASPALTGTPTAPNAAADTATAQIATTAFVAGQASASAPPMNGAASAGTATRFARADHVHPADTSRVPTARQVTAGSGLSGGGALSADVTLALAAAPTLTLLANLGPSAAVPAGATLSAVLDAAVANARGTLLVRAAAGWVPLAVGAAGQTLQSNGTDPVYAAPSPAAGSVRYDTGQSLTATQQGQARANLAAAEGGANASITALSGLTTPLSLGQGGTGQATASAALSALGGAPLASPAFTGTPTLPTAPVDTVTTQGATTAFVLGQAAASAPLANGTAAAGTATRFARADHVHPTDATRAPLASPAFTGTPTAPTAAAGTSSTQIATTAFVAGAVASGGAGGGAGLPGFRRRNRNGSFAVNQRGVSGTVTLAAGAYGHDGWKAGSGGCTYTFSTAAGGDATLTITAGSLIQVLEAALCTPEGGAYTLSWSGSAQARVYQGSASGGYAAAPVAATGLAAGTNTVVEFGPGTLGLVQFEPGAVATAYERRDDELRRCQRYYETGQTYIYGQSYGAGASLSVPTRLVTKAHAPNVGLSGIAASGMNTPSIAVTGLSDVLFYASSTVQSGVVYYQFNWTASAEL